MLPGSTRETLPEPELAGAAVELAPVLALLRPVLGDVIDVDLELLAILGVVLEHDALKLVRHMRGADPPVAEEGGLQQRRMRDVDSLGGRYDRVRHGQLCAPTR